MFGYYIATTTGTLTTNAHKKVKIPSGTWLCTDGSVVGRFDQNDLEWVLVPVVLDDRLSAQLTLLTRPTTYDKLNQAFETAMTIPGEDMEPELPKPNLKSLAAYLKSRRSMFAYSYDRR